MKTPRRDTSFDYKHFVINVDAIGIFIIIAQGEGAAYRGRVFVELALETMASGSSIKQIDNIKDDDSKRVKVSNKTK